MGERLVDQAQQQMEGWRVLAQGEQGVNALALFLYQVNGVDGFLERDRLLRHQASQLPGLLADLKRIQHLIHHPMLDAPATETFRTKLQRLEAPPPLEQTDELKAWLEQADEYYAEYQGHYTRLHRDWWQTRLDREADSWQPPALAASRHLGLQEALSKLEQSRATIARLRCPGLSSLDFQPLCNCGFDGETAPIIDERQRFDALKQTIEQRLTQYFQQQQVKQRMRDWQDQGLDLSSGTLSYLQGEQKLPDIRDVSALDKHLAGLDLTVQLDTDSTLALLTSRSWETTELLAALEKHWRPHQGKRLKFSPPAASGAPQSVLLWCAEQALRHGVALPNGLGHSHHQRITDAIRPDWVSDEALRQLDQLALPDEAVDNILGWLHDGTLALPMDIVTGPVGALVELRRPSPVDNAEAVADLASRLYAQHTRLLPLAKSEWLERLNTLATPSLPPEIQPLTECLQTHEEAQWLLIDCLGPALVNPLEPRLIELFQAWRAPQRSYAQVGTETTTDACYKALLDAALNHPMEKINVIDELIHSDFLPFTDLSQLARTHLELAIKPLLARLDPARPLLVFADHGFRLRADGRRYEHGGNSVLERLVPVWWFGSYHR